MQEKLLQLTRKEHYEGTSKLGDHEKLHNLDFSVSPNNQKEKDTMTDGALNGARIFFPSWLTIARTNFRKFLLT
uniref:Uncharacterized protein n=1 Tax=Rhizophora mucronata TaxID=61149 RepID=A0A2P2QUK6_RHIMU